MHKGCGAFMSVINNINLCLAERGMNGAELARALGFSSGVYSQWNTGLTTPRKSTIKKIADYFGVSVEYLLRDNEKAAPEGGVGVSASALEAARLFDRAEPWVRDQVLSLLRAAESAHAAQGDGPKES